MLHAYHSCYIPTIHATCLPFILYAYPTVLQSSTGVFHLVWMVDNQRQPLYLLLLWHCHMKSTWGVKCLKYMILFNLTLCQKPKTWNPPTNTSRTVHSYWRSLFDFLFQNTGKLDPRWEENWTVKAIKGSFNTELTDRSRTKTVHVNRLRTLQPEQHKIPGGIQPPVPKEIEWEPPQIEHITLPAEVEPPVQRYPLRDRYTPDHFQNDSRTSWNWEGHM